MAFTTVHLLYTVRPFASAVIVAFFIIVASVVILAPIVCLADIVRITIVVVLAAGITFTTIIVTAYGVAYHITIFPAAFYDDGLHFSHEILIFDFIFQIT